MTSSPPPERRRLAVVCLGHPLDPRTWSGTPAQVCAQLRRRGLLGAPINSEAYAPKPLVLATKVLSKIYYQGSRYVRLGRIERPLRARHVARALRRDGSAKATDDAAGVDLLHVNVHALPSRKADGRHGFGPPVAVGRRFLLTDGTWDLWQRYATDRERVLPRLVRDIERLERRSLAEMDHVFVIGEHVRENLVDHYEVPAERITVVGSGRGSILPFDGPKDYANGHVLFVAKERFRDKGGEALLAGFQLARKVNPALRLTLLGRDEYTALAASNPGVTAHGRVSREELQGIFQDASLFALPARNEPWGLVYLEALSCRTPVLGLRRNALPEITGQGRWGFCLEDDRPETVGQALLEAFRDPGRLAVMGAEGQRHCLEHFTWERMVDRMLEAIPDASPPGLPASTRVRAEIWSDDKPCPPVRGAVLPPGCLPPPTSASFPEPNPHGMANPLVQSLLNALPRSWGVALRSARKRWRTGVGSRAIRQAIHRHCYGDDPVHVLSGPFRGMGYLDEVTWGPITPQWLGSYEAELHPWIEEITAAEPRYRAIIDVGAAEGYYAVGLAWKCRVPVFAFDVDPFARAQQRRLSRFNAVAEHVHVGAWCEFADITRIVSGVSSDEGAAGAAVLLICDIEGGERELLDPVRCPALRECDLLVELHEAPAGSHELRDLLDARFAVSHRIEERGVLPRDPADWRARLPVDGLTDEELRRGMDEGRPPSQSWLFLRRRGGGPPAATGEGTDAGDAR